MARISGPALGAAGALSPRESALAERIKLLKREAGSHSPCAPTLAKMIPELRLRVDACFLSNPYATDLFLEYLHREVIRTGKLRKLLEFYPSQNRVIAGKLSGALGVPPEYLFVGNGAVEIIQAILHRFTGDKILVNLPTFSPYHELPGPTPRSSSTCCLEGRRLPVRPRSLPRAGAPGEARHGRPDQPQQPGRRLHPVRHAHPPAGRASPRAQRDRRRELHPLRLRGGRLRVSAA